MELDKGINIISGENAQGKTNILEAFYMCSKGKSHRVGITDRDIISFGCKQAHIRTNIASSHTDRIDIHLSTNAKKSISVNGISIQKLGDLFGIVNVVFFGPQDLHLIQSGPGERRRFMDIELCQINNIYYHYIKKYYKLLKQRNNLLKALQKSKKQLDMLDIYDIQLAESAVKLIEIRRDFTDKLNVFAPQLHSRISSGREQLRLEYKPDVEGEEFLSKLSKNHEKDIAYGSTSNGIHKDDIVFYLNDINARNFASQGQQRSACLSTKLAEIELIKSEKGENPVLLLDDVLSELDKLRQHSLIEAMGDIQTIITCTGIEDSIKNISTKSKIFIIKNGKII
jgi:DNA replication and repair protein RecF